MGPILRFERPLLVALAVALGAGASPAMAGRAGSPARDTSTAAAKRSSAAARTVKPAAATPLRRSPVKRPYVKSAPFQNGPIKVGGTSLLPSGTYRDLRNASIELLERFDPANSYFLGLGRDPAPIIAFLQNLGGTTLAGNFVGASGKGWGTRHNPPWSTYEQYFDRFIPRAVIASGRDIVLIDQTTSGLDRYGNFRAGTVHEFAPFVARYLKQKGYTGTLRKVAFSPNRHPRDVVRIDTNKYPEVGRFLSAPYESLVSEHPRHTLGVDDPPESPATASTRRKCAGGRCPRLAPRVLGWAP